MLLHDVANALLLLSLVAIMADGMGLGKTLQNVALVWTLLVRDQSNE